MSNCGTCSKPILQEPSPDSCQCPSAIQGKFRNEALISAKSDELVRCGMENGWDRESLLEWVRVAWLNQGGK